MIKDYRALVERLISTYDEIDYDVAVEMARLPEMARGFGHVKAGNMDAMRTKWRELDPMLMKSTKGQAQAA